MNDARIIADSLNEHGQRLTTMVLKFPRIVLAEFNTHRMLSRNSASSRAIPFKRMVEMVNQGFFPMKWMKEHPGMQGTEYLEDDSLLLHANWLNARQQAIQSAENLSRLGVSKQLCNRLLEPFMWHTAIVTATEWENFFALRAHPDAEIHIQDLAHRMLEAYNASEPKQLKAGEWHIPFGDQMDEARLCQVINDKFEVIPYQDAGYIDLSMYEVKIATARCARVSYMNFEGKDDYEADIKLYDRLLKSGHMSPFEHCARAMSHGEYRDSVRAWTVPATHKNPTGISQGWCANFRGWTQLRKTIEGENKSDNRVTKK